MNLKKQVLAQNVFSMLFFEISTYTFKTIAYDTLTFHIVKKTPQNSTILKIFK